MANRQDGVERQEDGPAIAQQDWSALEGTDVRSGKSFQQDGFDARLHEGEREDHSLEEDDDNAYQESDDALPDDREESALRRDPGREKSRFDQS